MVLVGSNMIALTADAVVLVCGMVLAIGVELIGRGRWGDQSKGRPRCPRCWYDMRGTVPRLICPECGHDAVQEQQLYLDHRRPWLIVLGVVMISAALLVLLGVSYFRAEV